MASKIKNVTFIVQTLGLGGAEVFLTDLMVEWQRQHSQITAWVTYPRFRAYLKQQGLQVRRLPAVIDIVGNWKGLVKALVFWPYALAWYFWVVWQQRHTQVIVLSGFIEKILVGWVSRLIPVSIVWLEFGPMNSLLHKFGGLPKWLYTSVVDTPRLVIVPSENTKRHLLQDGLILAHKMTVIPCGRNIPALPKSIFEEIPTVVCVSRLEPGKGQDVLVKAWPHVLAQVPNAQLLIAGEGDFLEKIEAEIKRQRVEKSVTVLGRVPNVWRLLQSATVCVFPSLWELEGFGMVTIEAMALSKPIVAFATGPTPEIIQHQRTGLLAAPGNVTELAAYIVKLLNDSSLRKKIGQAANRRFHQHYTIEQVATAYSQAIASALSHEKS